MAEYCLDCLNKIMNKRAGKKTVVLSRELDLCEACGQMKRVVVKFQWWYIWALDIADWFEYVRWLKERKSGEK